MARRIGVDTVASSPVGCPCAWAEPCRRSCCGHVRWWQYAQGLCRRPRRASTGNPLFTVPYASAYREPVELVDDVPINKVSIGDVILVRVVRGHPS